MSATRQLYREKASLAAIRYLEHQGYNILDVDYMTPVGIIDVVATHDEEDEVCLTFVSVSFGMYEIPDDPEITRSYRKTLESRAMTWFRERAADFADQGILFPQAASFDTVAIGVFSEDRAFLRHHHNVLGTMPAEALALSEA